MTEDVIPYRCPYCDQRNLETVAKVLFVRGKILMIEGGNRILVGCIPCVRRNIYQEVGETFVRGWWSPTALFATPVVLVYDALRGLLLFRNPKGVRKQLRAAGIPDRPEPMSLLKVGYMLAAKMIGADGKILPEEIAVAEGIGVQLFSDFDSKDFREIVNRHGSLPAVEELASLLRDSLTDEGKTMVSRYLHAIASADGSVSPSELSLLARIEAKWTRPPIGGARAQA